MAGKDPFTLCQPLSDISDETRWYNSAAVQHQSFPGAPDCSAKNAFLAQLTKTNPMTTRNQPGNHTQLKTLAGVGNPAREDLKIL